MPGLPASAAFGGHDEELTATSLRALVRGAETILEEAGVASPRRDAEAIAASSLGLDRIEWFRLPAGDAPLDDALLPGATDGFVARFAAAVERRRSREPLQRIVGRAAFRHIEVEVADDVFVPRPETELVAQVAIDEAARLRTAGRDPLVVDLCCGSGVIAISVAVEVAGSTVLAVDASPAAVAAARANAARLGGGVEVMLGDVADPGVLAHVEGRVDVVVGNPPYIPPDAVPKDPEVRDHDPDLALYGGGPDGLEVPRAVVVAAAGLLRPGGLLVMEHAEVQAAAVRADVAAAGVFEDVETRPDLTGRDRMVVARRSPDVEHSPS